MFGLPVLLVLAPIGRPMWHLLRAVVTDRRDRPAPPPGTIDDASGLNATPVAEIVECPADAATAERELAALVERARTSGRPISIGGARHSMGGQTIQAGGITLNMRPFRAMDLDEAQDLLHVGSGALWSEVLAYLNSRGRSVAIMQSNSSFTVGGSLSVNCHGWQPNRPPIASSVESFRLLLADGRTVRCSRGENRELFSLALGGYSLFGILLDVDLRVVPNEEYRLERLVLPTAELAPAFRRQVSGAAGVGMAYGRLAVAPARFLRESILNVYQRVPGGEGKPSTLEFPEAAPLTRAIFRGQVGSDYGKELRWSAEKRLGGLFSGSVHRNQLLAEPAAVFENRAAASTDVLHEYFVPLDGFAAFADSLSRVVSQHHGDLLNVTVRHVLRDDDTFLRYADQEMLALVLLFNQPRSRLGDEGMQAMTRDLVDAALRAGGRHYLPYRLHATPQQMAAAYPQLQRFFDLKRRYDPEQVFQNAFYARYAEGRTH